MSFDLLAELRQAKREIAVLGILPLALDAERLRSTLLAVLEQSPTLCLRLLCESDDDLFYRSLSTDTPFAEPRLAFAALRFRRNLVVHLQNEWVSRAEANPEDAGRFQASIVYTPVTAYIVRLDGEHLFQAPVLPGVPRLDDFTMLPSESLAANQADACISYVLDATRGGRYVAPLDAEVIQLYDQDRAPRGIFPRESFYDTDYHQFVVWDFVFDRAGNLLIHQRAANAKDNQGMWDKSVGGHVDWSKELSSSEAAVRELIEELFEDELNREAMAHFTESERNVIHLGDWRPDKRGLRALEEIRHFREELAFFTLPIELQTDTPRYLPDGTTRNLRVIVHAYIFVANRRLSQTSLGRLANSTFRLLRPGQIKTEIQRGVFEDADGVERPFAPTPDLRAIMTGRLRDVLEEVSEMIRCTFVD